MLSKLNSRLLSEVGAGTAIGELLRRYWMPIAAVSEVDQKPIIPVRILGEDLVLYRDARGQYGLLDRRCPHRAFDLAYGTVEPCGLRCSYHGWSFNEDGRCLEQPYEETRNPSTTFKDRVRTKSYPVQVAGGLVWTYMGPTPASLLPDWAGFYSPGYTITSFVHLPCNWVQVMEGFYDPVHVEWLHDRWSYRLHGKDVPPSRPTHTSFRWVDFDYGVVFQRQLEGSEQWLADRTVVFPNIDGAGGQGWYMTWLVPVDDLHCIAVYRLTITSWKTRFGQIVIPPKAQVDQKDIPCHRTHVSLDPLHGPTKDFGTHLISQDYAAWLGPGPLVDRTNERLADSDIGVIMFRKRLLAQAEHVAAGRDPLGTIRDPEKNTRITLPGARKNYGLQGEGLPGMVGDDDVMLRAFLPADLPDEIKQAIDETMSALVANGRPTWWKKKAPGGSKIA
ncbi:MAG TPA: Rieske 2Fe-2S domain-containing protein [Vicinamibacterales bacterium]|nr:Rieske 2Fe-2S domain-containing protein [Vicinamibacterales bacterium]